jgi:hypothetical protein
LPKNPLAEVFGYKIDDMSADAKQHRKEKLCPFNNGVVRCTKVSRPNPLGVCSVYEEGLETPTICCPVRFREGVKDKWLGLNEAADFFFPSGTRWMPLGEVKLHNKSGVSAGNIDMVLVALGANDQVVNFGAMEIQSVYNTGNIRDPFEAYMKDPSVGAAFDWSRKEKYPSPDFLSSTRKRLMPQLLSKGEILQAWKTKQAILVDERFYQHVPDFKEVPPRDAEVVWLICTLDYNAKDNRYHLVLKKRVYTRFKEMLTEFAKSEAGDAKDFIEQLQKKLEREKKKKAKATKSSAPKLPFKTSVRKPRKRSKRKV